ncbi:ROK family protein [Pseudolysinimonas yzui]|uniref:NagC family transcriptional regulator n=1 Tax=Pseudolysinimonas yzui TaxID=2708254 RepID=A0A8J3GRX3_9MICO|nr:ROK family protein [Pseudolysinimonas yzui]GHF20010.1 NagC family transcriptional regulator [Pseudolysinimonas yzui]
MTLRIGIDIGGTKTEAVALAADGTVVAEHRLATGFGAAAVLDTAENAVRALAAALGSTPEEFTTVGVGIPGAVDRATGRVAHAVNLGLEDLDLGGDLAARLGRPVRVENDVNAAALGAWQALGGGDSDSMAYLNLGTGLAAGLVLGGRLWRGSRGVAGEIGHIPVDPAGPVCPCGQRGCLELAASGSGLARSWAGGDSVRELFTTAATGDADAVAVRDRLVEHVAAAVRLLVLTVDPDRVVIGGGLSSLGDELLGAVRAVLETWAAESGLLAMLDLASRVEVLPRDFPAAAVGAALVGASGD